MKTSPRFNLLSLIAAHMATILPAAMLMLGAQTSHAGSASWLSSPSNNNWNNAANWTLGGPPNGPSDTATFNSSSQSGISFSATTGLNGIIFNQGASAYAITVPTSVLVNISGTGIANSGGVTQNWLTTTGASGSAGFIRFLNNATAGSATVFTNNGCVAGTQNTGGAIRFEDTSSAGACTFVNNSGTINGASGGTVQFEGNSTAGNGVFINHSSALSGARAGYMFIAGTSTAGDGTFTNEGAAISGGFAGTLGFEQSSTAGSGTFINNGGTVSGGDGGITDFGNTSTAGNAILIANAGSGGGNGGAIDFHADSTGGTARVEVFGNGKLFIYAHNAPGVTIGSLEGDGTVLLGANNLTVGGNNLSTTFSGIIQDFGANGTFTKIGAGILTFEGGASNDHVADTVTLSIASGSTVNLNFNGTPDTIHALVLGGVVQSAGLYGSAASGAPNQRPQFAGAGRILVTTPVPVTVTNTSDSGAGSLRQALADAEDGDTITFNIPSPPSTITLTSDQLTIDKNITISGPGANVLTVARGGGTAPPYFRIFQVTPGNTVTIEGLTISNGFLFPGSGGGIYNDHSTLTVKSCTLSGNNARTPSGAGYGGAIYSDGSNAGSATLTVVNSTLSGNTSNFGGGIFNDGNSVPGSATLTVVNSTLSDNEATLAASGIYSVSTATVANSTVSTNAGQNTAGIANNGGALTLGNTILTSSSGQSTISNAGTFTSLGYNLSNDNGGGFLTATGDQINTDPILGPIQDNGGPTFTHAPFSNSPAIDQGQDIGPTGRDQRGSLRPLIYDPSIIPPAGGDRSDIGAVELPPGVIPTSAISRKTHGGGAGTFDINLPLAGVAGVECRSGGATNDYQVIVTFATPVTFTSATVNDGTGSIGSATGNGTDTVTLNLTGVTNAQRLTLALFGVNDGSNSGNVGVRMGVLVGDTNGDGIVNAGDTTQTRSRSGQTTTATNFRSDVNGDGVINSGDQIAVRSRSGTSLP